MRRVITKSVGRRFQAGKVFNYPVATWEAIAQAAGMGLEDFTDDVEMVSARAVKEERARRLDESRAGEMVFKPQAPKHGVRR